MLEGYTPIPIDKFGGLAQAWPPDMLMESLMSEALNVAYTMSEIGSREGLSLAFESNAPFALSGAVNFVATTQGMDGVVCFDINGTMWEENPNGGGTLVALPKLSSLVLPSNAAMNAASAYGKVYAAFVGGTTPTGTPCYYDGVIVQNAVMPLPMMGTGTLLSWPAFLSVPTATVINGASTLAAATYYYNLLVATGDGNVYISPTITVVIGSSNTKQVQFNLTVAANDVSPMTIGYARTTTAAQAGAPTQIFTLNQTFFGTSLTFIDAGATPNNANPSLVPTTASCTSPSATGESGGSLLSGTYYYRICLIDPITQAYMYPSPEVSVTLTGGQQSVLLGWTQANGGAQSFAIFRGTAAGMENLVQLATLTGSGTTYSYTDDNTAFTQTGFPPPSIAPGLRYMSVLYQDSDDNISGASNPVPVNFGSPILEGPTLGLSNAAGTVLNGTYFIGVTTIDAHGNESLMSPESTITVIGGKNADGTGGNAEIVITWGAVTGAASYKVYFGVGSGQEAYFVSVSAPTVTYTWTNSGPLTVGAPPQTNAQNGVLQLIDAPIGPPQTAKRLFAFTASGASPDGPYFYIPQAGTNGAGNWESSTVIPDNTTTSVFLNFDDDFLATSSNVDNQFRCVPLPPEASVMYSTTTDRLIWYGEPRAVFRVSDVGQPANYYGDTGFFQFNIFSDDVGTAAFEYRDQLYCATANAIGHVTPNAGDPATWSIEKISNTVGVIGPRAFAVANDFVFIVHRSGAYIYTGGAFTWVSDELLGYDQEHPGLWQRINWASGASIWVAIDESAKTVRIGVPLDNATATSHIIKVNYLDGWERGIRFSPFTGKYHYTPGRRWSLDTITANFGVTANRPYTPAGPYLNDKRAAVAQTILLSPVNEGQAFMVDPNATADGENPFTWAFTTGALSPTEDTPTPMRRGVSQLGLLQFRAVGSGSVSIQPVVNSNPPGDGTSIGLSGNNAGDYRTLIFSAGEDIGLRFSGSNSSPGVIRMRNIIAYMKMLWATRASLP